MVPISLKIVAKWSEKTSPAFHGLLILVIGAVLYVVVNCNCLLFVYYEIEMWNLVDAILIYLLFILNLNFIISYKNSMDFNWFFKGFRNYPRDMWVSPKIISSNLLKYTRFVIIIKSPNCSFVYNITLLIFLSQTSI